MEVPLVDTYRCCVALITTIDAHPVARLVASVVTPLSRLVASLRATSLHIL